MDKYLYLESKNFVLQTMYEYLALKNETMPLWEYLNYRCFDSLQGAETVDELYAANYFMWFSLRKLHELNLDSNHTKEIDKIVDYLEGGEPDDIIQEDIEELKEIKKYILEDKGREKLDFLRAMLQMDHKLRIRGNPSFERYGKTNDNINLETVKEMLCNTASNYVENFLCLATYFKICMHEGLEPDFQTMNYLNDFLQINSSESIITSFKTADEKYVKDYIGFLNRCRGFKTQMKKDDFLDILEQKNIKYNAGNYTDRIEIGNIWIVMNTTCSNDATIPKWNIIVADDTIKYTIAQFDNRNDAYKYILENSTE